MKLIKNKIIPFGSFSLINLFGFIFYKDGKDLNLKTLNHEAIHSAQMKELYYIFFYVWYILEWIIRLFLCKFNSKEAYKNIVFEKEAYAKDTNLDYLNSRGRYSFLKYIDFSKWYIEIK